jgi:hypothetical protein
LDGQKGSKLTIALIVAGAVILIAGAFLIVRLFFGGEEQGNDTPTETLSTDAADQLKSRNVNALLSAYTSYSTDNSSSPQSWDQLSPYVKGFDTSVSTLVVVASINDLAIQAVAELSGTSVLEYDDLTSSSIGIQTETSQDAGGISCAGGEPCQPPSPSFSGDVYYIINGGVCDNNSLTIVSGSSSGAAILTAQASGGYYCLITSS